MNSMSIGPFAVSIVACLPPELFAPAETLGLPAVGAVALGVPDEADDEGVGEEHAENRVASREKARKERRRVITREA